MFDGVRPGGQTGPSRRASACERMRKMDGQPAAVEEGSVHWALRVCGSGDRAASGAGSLFHNVDGTRLLCMQRIRVGAGVHSAGHTSM